MTVHRGRSVASFLLLTCQVAALGLAVVLQNLSSRRMGVMRDLVFRRQVLEKTVLSPQMMTVYQFGLLLGAVVCLVLLVRRAGAGQREAPVRGLLGAFVANLVALGLISLPAVERLLAYPVLVPAALIAVVLQYVKLLLWSVPVRKGRSEEAATFGSGRPSGD